MIFDAFCQGFNRQFQTDLNCKTKSQINAMLSGRCAFFGYYAMAQRWYLTEISAKSLLRLGK